MADSRELNKQDRRTVQRWMRYIMKEIELMLHWKPF